MGILLSVVLGLWAPYAWAASTAAVTIHSSPRHLVAPATEVFIVTVPKHSSIIPAKAEVFYADTPKSHYRMALKKAAAWTWGGSVYAAIPGTLAVDVYAKNGQLLGAKRFPVTKAKESWAPRIIIGVIFIGIALWYWRRMQNVTGGRANPRR